jgi:hypothetical protein
VKTLLRGTINGVLATLVMSLVLAAARLLGLLYEPPPRQITAEAGEKIGLGNEEDKGSLNVASTGAHLAFGSGCGILFQWARHFLPGPRPLHGVAYGLAVWAVNYLGILPSLDLYPPPKGDSRERVGVMIAAHAVYGASLGKLPS